MKKLNTLDWISMILLIIGGLNWGLVGLINMDLVKNVFGAGIIAKIIYILVGLAAVYALVMAGKMGKKEEAQ